MDNNMTGGDKYLNITIKHLVQGGMLHFYDFQKKGEFDSSLKKITACCKTEKTPPSQARDPSRDQDQDLVVQGLRPVRRLLQPGRARDEGQASRGQPRSTAQVPVGRVRAPVQSVALLAQVRDEQIPGAVAVEVLGEDSHPGLGLSGLVVGHTAEQRLVDEPAVRLLDPQLVGVAVVGHGSSGPEGIANAIRLAARAVDVDAVARTGELLEQSGATRAAMRDRKEEL